MTVVIFLDESQTIENRAEIEKLRGVYLLQDGKNDQHVLRCQGTMGAMAAREREERKLNQSRTDRKKGKNYLLALVFLLLRLRRRTRFFLHLALIFDN